MLKNIFSLLIALLAFNSLILAQDRPVSVAISDRFEDSLHTLTSTAPDSAAEKVRVLIYNSLVKKNERFEYVGELAKDVKIDYQNLTITFVLHNDVKFHNGKELTSTDAKYTLETLFQANGYKSASFYDSEDGQRKPHILEITAIDKNTLILKVRRIDLINYTLANLVAIPIIPEGTVEQQKEEPIGTGAFKVINFSQKESLVELEAFSDYWEGAPKISKLALRTITDSIQLKNELFKGEVDISINPIGFSPNEIKDFSNESNLQAVVSDGANIRHIGFNTKSKNVSNPKFRQAVGYAIDREKIVTELLKNQAKVAHSILPAESWAYSDDVKYEFNPTKAKKLLREISYKGQKISFKIAAGSYLISEFAKLIQKDLKNVGINVVIETKELNTLLSELKQGNYQLTTTQWVGGNQDPIFLRDLFYSKESTELKEYGRNRWRYSNPKFDEAIEEAKNATDKETATNFYKTAQEVVAKDLPLLPLWYPANIVVANKRVGNIKISNDENWSFLKDITLN